MSEYRKISKNVLDFLADASRAYGKMEEENFSDRIFCDLLETGVDSPIEDLFYIAIKLQCASMWVDVNPTPDYEKKDGTVTDRLGLFITPQQKIGKYRVDFVVNYNDINGMREPIVVELDGHDFHDKDKHQRAYEKSRDRFLVKEGYKILHFTGSEVCADPHKVAYEVLSTLRIPNFEAEDLDGFDPNNRLGRG